jgi:hypothetical protein
MEYQSEIRSGSSRDQSKVREMANMDLSQNKRNVKVAQDKFMQLEEKPDFFNLRNKAKFLVKLNTGTTL